MSSSLSCCSKALSFTSHIMTLVSVALTISSLSEQNFIQGSISPQGSGWYYFSFGLFNSCLATFCTGSDPFMWSYSYGRGLMKFAKQWQSFQAFIIAEIVFRSISWLMTATRSHWESKYPLRLGRINNIITFLHTATVICGTIAVATMGAMPARLRTDIQPNWVAFGFSATLQFIAYGIGTLAIFIYGLAYRGATKTEESSPLFPSGQQVTIIMNGVPVVATIAPSQTQLAQPPQVQHHNPNPMMQYQTIHQPIIQPVHQPMYAHPAQPIQYAQPIQQVQHYAQPPQYSYPQVYQQ